MDAFVLVADRWSLFILWLWVWQWTRWYMQGVLCVCITSAQVDTVRIYSISSNIWTGLQHEFIQTTKRKLIYTLLFIAIEAVTFAFFALRYIFFASTSTIDFFNEFTFGSISYSFVFFFLLHRFVHIEMCWVCSDFYLLSIILHSSFFFSCCDYFQSTSSTLGMRKYFYK